tara:strand:+ start:2665 stop:2817 length:153 start_codon:yes stop_codon:yes gene_type:complete
MLFKRNFFFSNTLMSLKARKSYRVLILSGYGLVLLDAGFIKWNIEGKWLG